MSWSTRPSKKFPPLVLVYPPHLLYRYLSQHHLTYRPLFKESIVIVESWDKTVGISVPLLLQLKNDLELTSKRQQPVTLPVHNVSPSKKFWRTNCRPKAYGKRNGWYYWSTQRCRRTNRQRHAGWLSRRAENIFSRDEHAIFGPWNDAKVQIAFKCQIITTSCEKQFRLIPWSCKCFIWNKMWSYCTNTGSIIAMFSNRTSNCWASTLLWRCQISNPAPCQESHVT